MHSPTQHPLARLAQLALSAVASAIALVALALLPCEFDLKRSDGYFEAGEYVVGLAGPDGDVGNNQRIVLKGDNPPVYRGAMDFTDNKSTKRGMKLQTVNSGIDAGSDNKEVAKNDTPEAKLPTTGDVAPVGTAPDMVPQTSYNRTAEEETVHEHPGCGCVAAGLERGSVGGGAAARGIGRGRGGGRSAGARVRRFTPAPARGARAARHKLRPALGGERH